MRRRRVLHLITKLELGGAQQNTLHCVRNHDRSNFEAYLAAGIGGLLDREAQEIEDATVYLLPYLKHPVSPLSDLLAVFRLASLFRREKIDLLHTHSSKAGIVGRLAARLAGVRRVVHTVHGWSFNDTQAPWRRKLYIGLERMAAYLTDSLVVVSSMNRKEGLLEGIGKPEQYRVIHSGIDIERFKKPERPREEVRTCLGISPSDVVVGTVACLKPQKAPLDFVRAAALASKQDGRLRFIIAGGGELLHEAEVLAETLGISGRISFLGWREDVVDLHHAFDIFLLTSLFEGLPRVVLQSMAAGVPVVATSVDGTPEVVEDGETGLLFAPGDPEGAAEAVIRMVRDENLRNSCSIQAAGRLDSDFDIDVMVKQLDDLYLSLLNRAG